MRQAILDLLEIRGPIQESELYHVLRATVTNFNLTAKEFEEEVTRLCGVREITFVAYLTKDKRPLRVLFHRDIEIVGIAFAES